MNKKIEFTMGTTISLIVLVLATIGAYDVLSLVWKVTH
jgi:hypothetical protein